MSKREGRPQEYEQPSRLVTIRATDDELVRIYQLDTRRRTEIMLDACDELEAFVEQFNSANPANADLNPCRHAGCATSGETCPVCGRVGAGWRGWGG